MNLSSLLVLSLLSVGASTAAIAQGVGQHPATSAAQRRAPGIDPNTFIVGHPASPRTRAGHANSHHPAVTLATQGGAAIDTNHFLVQPPASVQWTMAPAADVPVVASRASAPALASARPLVRSN